MRATTQKFKQIMASGNARDYVVKVDLTLADDPNTPTVLHLTEEDIWNDSFSIETASSGTSSFDIGTAVIGQCKFSLNNFDERFNQYDFFNASAVVWVGLVGDIDNNNHQVYYRMGFFTVDEPTFAGALIQLVLLDNMWKFDVPLSSVNLTYPITALNAILAICTYCGVQLDQTTQFHGASFSIEEAPKNEMNCRDFIQYVAMIGCNFCYITPEGKLKLRWYDTSSIPSESDLDGGTFDTNTTPYSDGDNADGGTFSTTSTPYSDGDTFDGGTFTDNQSVAYFTRLFNSTFGTDVITITGVKFVIEETSYSIGSAGYVLELENPLVNADNVNSVLNLIWDVLEDFSLRTFNITSVSDLSAEIGDCCAVKDYKGNYIYSWITLNTFKFSSHIIQCNAINPTRTLTKQYSKTVQTAVEVARQQTDEIISNYDLAVQMMNTLAVNAMGGYEDYEDLSTGGRIWYLSNMPITKNPTTGVCSFEAGSTVYKKSGSGFFVSRDGGQTWVNGYDISTGELVVNVLDAIGINFDWARGGTLTLGGYGNGHGQLSILDASNVEKVHGDNTGIAIGSNGASDSKIKLTTSGSMEYYYGGNYSGEIHMSAQNYGTEQNPDIRDTLTLEDFYDICLRSESGKSHIHLWTDESSGDYGNIILETVDDSAGHGEVSISSRYDDGDTFRDVELLINSLGIHLNGRLVAGGDNAIDAYPAIVESDGSIYDYDFNNGILTGRTLRQGSTFPHSVWHSWSSGGTTYVAIILGVGVTQAVFPDCTNDEHHAYDPYIECASNVSPPKITDMVTNGTTITVTFTAVTSQQAGSGQTSLCVIKLMEHIL